MVFPRRIRIIPFISTYLMDRLRAGVQSTHFAGRQTRRVVSGRSVARAPFYLNLQFS
jgi:hypothetical protein